MSSSQSAQTPSVAASHALPRDPDDLPADASNRKTIDSIAPDTRPVELSNLPASRRLPSIDLGDMQGLSGLNVDGIESHPVDNARLAASSLQPPGPAADARSASLDESAIGPATDQPPLVNSSPLSSPQLVITLLLHSTETRHPYIINEKYLRRRNVVVADNDPINMSVYTLKELIWRDWRDDWETKPASPTSIRLIHMGRLLDDKSHLKDCRFTTGEAPHVVHMTIKPQEVVDDEDARMGKGSTRERSGSERSPVCRCVVM